MGAQATFAKNLKKFRLQRGLTQTQLAEELGVALQTVFSYESEATWPRPQSVDDLADVLGVRPWQLLADEGEGGIVPPDLVEHIAAAAASCGLKVSRPK